MNASIEDVIDLKKCPLNSDGFRAECKKSLNENGVLVLQKFLKPEAVRSIQGGGKDKQHLAYYTARKHNIYLSPTDTSLSLDHPRNREVSSSKGCITTDQISHESALRTLYNSQEFRGFLCAVLGETGLYEYADPLSSINLHYASAGQELGWHFDNSSFAITLLIQKPDNGGVFEYVQDVRDADKGEMNYALSEKILDGMLPTKSLSMDAGDLVLFRGRNSMHRVTPVIGQKDRMLVVLAYNTEPGISLSESARMTFFGRLD